MLHLISLVYLRLANRPSAQFQNSSRQEQPPSSRYDPQVLGTRTAFLSSQARVLVLLSLCRAYFEQETPSKKNSLRFAQWEKQKKYYQRATYKDWFSKVHQWNTAFCFQRTNRLSAIFTTRSTYNEPCKICPQRTEATWMQVHQATWATAYPLHSREIRDPGRSC